MTISKQFVSALFIILPLFALAQIGIGTNNPDPSSILHLSSTSKGILSPRMTTQNRDEINNPDQGLLIYNTSTSNYNFYDGSWNDFSTQFKTVGVLGDVSTNSNTAVVIEGMNIVPSAGTYSVMFNSQFKKQVFNTFSTEQALIDLNTVYETVYNYSLPNILHSNTFGNSEILFSGIQTFPSQAFANGTLTLDGQNIPDSKFIFKIGAGLTIEAGFTIVLINGAKASDVFWIAESTIEIGAGASLKGTFISHGSTINVSAGTTLQGRLFSTSGTINLNASSVTVPTTVSTIDFGVLSNLALFTGNGAIINTGISSINGNVATNSGSISGLNSTSNSILYLPSNIIPILISDAVASFGIYQNGVLIENSVRVNKSNGNQIQLSLQTIATVLDGETIDVRWKCDNDGNVIKMGKRTLTLIKVK